MGYGFVFFKSISDSNLKTALAAILKLNFGSICFPKKAGQLFTVSLCWILIFQSACTKKQNPQTTAFGFRYHIPITPQTFDPILQRGTSSWFLLNHLYRPLVGIDQKDELYFSGAKDCTWKNHVYTCELKEDLKFEDGTPITSQHYKHSFELAYENANEAAGLFLSFKNQNPTLDVLTPSPQVISFVFKSYLPSEVYQLSRTEFGPRLEKKFYKHPDQILSSGPYKLLDYKKNQRITLTTNDINNSVTKSVPRPNISIYFIEDEGTALRMYESQKLDFIKNVPRTFFEKYKDQLYFQTMMRMDGVGFSNEILKHPELRIALIHSLDFKELQKIYHSKGVPGCPSLPSVFYKQNHCYEFDLNKAKKHWAQVDPQLKTRIWKLNFSEVGGKDIQKGMEWMAHQWKKNLGLDVRIEPLESGQFFQKIRTKKFDIIRKGLPLNSPACAEALSAFTTTSPNNFASLVVPRIDEITANLKQTDLKFSSQLKDLCDQGLAQIKSTYQFIPLGEMYFAFLSNNKFQGWTINSFNMLNLEDLRSNTDQ